MAASLEALPAGSARFGQVAFEDEGTKDRARTRLLRAAKKHGSMPIGFVSSQLNPQRKLPEGHVTLLLTDLERSTELLRRLGDRYARLLAGIRRQVRAAVRRAGGREVDALAAALAIQRAMRAGPWPDGIEVRLRIGIHRGRPALTDTGYVGLAVHAAARIGNAAHGGQIVVSSAAYAAVADVLPGGVSLRDLGRWTFDGLPEPVDLFQLQADDLPVDSPPPRSAVIATKGGAARVQPGRLGAWPPSNRSCESLRRAQTSRRSRSTCAPVRR